MNSLLTTLPGLEAAIPGIILLIISQIISLIGSMSINSKAKTIKELQDISNENKYKKSLKELIELKTKSLITLAVHINHIKELINFIISLTMTFFLILLSNAALSLVNKDNIILVSSLTIMYILFWAVAILFIATSIVFVIRTIYSSDIPITFQEYLKKLTEKTHSNQNILSKKKNKTLILDVCKQLRNNVENVALYSIAIIIGVLVLIFQKAISDYLEIIITIIPGYPENIMVLPELDSIITLSIVVIVSIIIIFGLLNVFLEKKNIENFEEE